MKQKFYSSTQRAGGPFGRTVPVETESHPENFGFFQTAVKGHKGIRLESNMPLDTIPSVI